MCTVRLPDIEQVNMVVTEMDIPLIQIWQGNQYAKIRDSAIKRQCRYLSDMIYRIIGIFFRGEIVLGRRPFYLNNPVNPV
jgi:hypothetical protein